MFRPQTQVSPLAANGGARRSVFHPSTAHQLVWFFSVVPSSGTHNIPLKRVLVGLTYSRVGREELCSRNERNLNSSVTRSGENVEHASRLVSNGWYRPATETGLRSTATMPVSDPAAAGKLLQSSNASTDTEYVRQGPMLCQDVAHGSIASTLLILAIEEFRDFQGTLLYSWKMPEYRGTWS